MGCIAEIVYGTVECNGDCEHCHWWDESQERKEQRMNEQWKQLKDTIVDIRDNNEFEHEDVTLMCRFLVNYMEVLEKQMQSPCKNTIDRQAVLDIVDSYSESRSNVEDVTQDIISDIMALSPVNPQIKTGHWIDDKCSICGKGIENLIDSREWYRNEQPNFCPFCGLKLVNSQESEG